MIVIKRISDNAFVGTLASNMTAGQEILLNVIPNFGGSPEDYEAVDYEPLYVEPMIPPKTELELLQETNETLKIRVAQAEQIAIETSVTQQELLELLIEVGVI